MIEKKNNSYSDQVNLMNYIISSDYKLHVKEEMINGNIYNNKIIEIDGIKICVLDF